jgi:HlyD family secretion protein
MYKLTYDRTQAMYDEGITSEQSRDDAQQKYLFAANTRDKAAAQIHFSPNVLAKSTVIGFTW